MFMCMHRWLYESSHMSLLQVEQKALKPDLLKANRRGEWWHFDLAIASDNRYKQGI